MTTTNRAPAATREALGPTLIKLRREGLDLVVVDADLGKSTSARQFGDAFPERFFTFGVAEQNLISVAAGLASMGHVVFASTFAVFAEHAFDQLRMSVAQPHLNVKLVASHGGVSTGEDGASAQSIEDLALMCSLVGFRVIVPCDVVEAAAAVEAAARTPGPFYIRTSRPKSSVIYTDGARFEVGKANTLREGRDVSIIACGLMVERALAAAQTLAGAGVQARVLNMATVRPLDLPALERAAAETGAIVVAEEHLAHSGLGALCAQALASSHPVPMEFVAVDDRYGESGTSAEVMDLMGLTPERIVAAARRAVDRKRV
ncbi:MAG: transketolase family protein [Dehalococcoidia bacterium]|nr:transketolase family protein [Dehalococcoidia bacterium]